MNISKNLKKDFWTRRIHPDNAHRHISANPSNYKNRLVGGQGVAFINLTQDDFLNEISPAAHFINSQYMSQREIYAPTGRKDANGKEEWAVVGNDPVQSVSLGWQEWIASKKTAHFSGDGFWVSNEDGDSDDAFAKLQSWMDIIDIKAAFTEAVDSCFRTGDAAIYLYQTGDSIDYEVFSFLKGDVLYPVSRPRRTPELYRKYKVDGREFIDRFTTDVRETWCFIGDDKEVIDDIKAYMGTDTPTEYSEDGYALIDRVSAQTGKDLLQVIYFRVPDIPSGTAEMTIEDLEEACSYVSEEVRGSAFPILFLKTEKIINLPSNKMNSKTIGVKGSSESLAHSDAKFLAPPDASNIATLHISTLKAEIIRSTMSVDINPDILKSGADSSTTIKILYAPEIQWCQKEWIYFARPMRQLVEVLKRLVAKVEGDFESFSKLKLSVGQNIWIPQNRSEEVKIELDQVYARVKSRKAAINDLANQHVGDYETIRAEWEEELKMKAQIPAEAQAKVDDNPNIPPIDNNSKGKTILE